MELVRASLLFLRTHALRTFKSRRAVVCVVLALLPVAAAALVAQLTNRVSPAEIATHLGGLLMLQLVVPILALVAGSAVVAEEVEDRTITYLFARPIPRPALLLGRWLATVVFLSVVLSFATWLLVLAADRSRASGAKVDAALVQPLFEAVLLGGAVYSGLFAVAGVFFRHPVLVGLGYAFAIEGFLANLPGQNQALTIQYHLRSWIVARGPAVWRTIEGYALVKPESAARALSTLLVILVLALAIGSWRISRREFVLTS